MPAHGSATRHPLPSPGSARPAFPQLNGTMRCSNVLPPSRRASWCFAWRYLDVRLRFGSRWSRCRIPAGREFVIRAPQPDLRRGEVRTSQGSQATLVDLCRVLRPRPDRTHLAGDGVPMLPPCCPRRRLPRVVLSRLNRTALALAVYASSSPLRCRRRKTRFRWLAGPCRVGLVTHRVAMKGFKDATSSPPLLSFSWRKDSLRQVLAPFLLGKNGPPVPGARRIPLCPQLLYGQEGP